MPNQWLDTLKTLHNERRQEVVYSLNNDADSRTYLKVYISRDDHGKLTLVVKEKEEPQPFLELPYPTWLELTEKFMPLFQSIQDYQIVAEFWNDMKSLQTNSSEQLTRIKDVIQDAQSMLDALHLSIITANADRFEDRKKAEELKKLVDWKIRNITHIAMQPLVWNTRSLNPQITQAEGKQNQNTVNSGDLFNCDTDDSDDLYNQNTDDSDALYNERSLNTQVIHGEEKKNQNSDSDDLYN